MTLRAAIAGGGLGGLACAKSLVDAGVEVELYEGLPYLGGRASTFRDDDGDWVEQGLHLFLGTYTEFQRLLEEVGQPPEEVVFWMSQVRLQDPAGRQAVYGTNPVRSPLKTFLSVLGQNGFLGPADKLAMVPIAAPAVRSMEGLRKRFDDRTVAQWWAENHGTEHVRERVLRPFCRAIQFTDIDQFSAYNLLGWFHHVAYGISQSLLGGYRGARDELIFRPIARYLAGRGAVIRTGAKLREIFYDAEQQRVKGFELESGERITADAYVAAVPAWALAPLMPAPLRQDPFFTAIDSLPVAPAIAVQLWFDRRVTPNADFVLVGRSAVPVYQDQAVATYPYSAGSRISATISPADGYLDWSDAQLVRLTLEALGQVQPPVREARVVKSVVLKHEKHLVRPLPGAMSARPTQATPVPNLFLAGDWTQQDYFGSQEGAVRGGRACAQEILRSWGLRSAQRYHPERR